MGGWLHVLQLIHIEMNSLAPPALVISFSSKNKMWGFKPNTEFVTFMDVFRGTECAVPSRFLRRGLLLRCQTLTSPRRQQTDVHPKCFPPAPKCCTFIKRTRKRSVCSNKVRRSHVKAHMSALSYFYQNNLSACTAITGYVADSDAW